MEEIFTYKTETDWVSYCILPDGRVVLSAHTDGKYSVGMLKAIRKTFNMFDEVYTVLPYDYLVEFYSKHATVELLDENQKLYLIRKG